MVVSLERVQFKFASIIGELCSDPVVLSQFAVWLDLRLAEYKSKGAISLDCSGEKPDPSWLKGLRAAMPVSAPAKRVLGSRLTPRSTGVFSRGGMYSRTSAMHRRQVNSHSKMSQQTIPRHSQDASEQLPMSDANNDNRVHSDQAENSEEILVIKDEANEPVYPVGLHEHHGGDAESRKRSASEISTGNMEEESSPYKLSKTLPEEDTSLNQSLMSVLGTSIDDNQDSSALGNDSDQIDYSINENTKRESSSYQWGNNSTDYTTVSSPSTLAAIRPSTSATVTSNSGLTDTSVSESDQQAQNEIKTEPVSAIFPTSLHPVADVEGPSNPGMEIVTGSWLGNREAEKERDFTVYENEMIVQNQNTMKKTISDLRQLDQFLQKVGERRDIYQITPQELDPLLSEFFLTVRNSHGEDYEPNTLGSFLSSFERYLKQHGYQFSLRSSMEFINLRNNIKSKQKQLKTAGKGKLPLRTEPTTKEEIEKLWETGQFGCHCPMAIINTLWFYTTINFGLRGREEHRHLCWGDVQLGMAEDGREFLEFVGTHLLASRGGTKRPETHPRMWDNPTDINRCPINVYKQYRSLRPQRFSKDVDPFYITGVPAEEITKDSDAWFRCQPIGVHRLASLMKQMASAANLSPRKRLTNNSVCKYSSQKYQQSTFD